MTCYDQHGELTYLAAVKGSIWKDSKITVLKEFYKKEESDEDLV